MPYTLLYHPDVKKVDLPKIDQKIKLRIKKAIEERLLVQPDIYAKPLQRTLKGYWKLRVGTYRVVFKFDEDTIIIFGIVHRKTAYQKIQKRKNASF